MWSAAVRAAAAVRASSIARTMVQLPHRTRTSLRRSIAPSGPSSAGPISAGSSWRTTIAASGDSSRIRATRRSTPGASVWAMIT